MVSTFKYSWSSTNCVNKPCELGLCCNSSSQITSTRDTSLNTLKKHTLTTWKCRGKFHPLPVMLLFPQKLMHSFNAKLQQTWRSTDMSENIICRWFSVRLLLLTNKMQAMYKGASYKPWTTKLRKYVS